MWLEPNRLSSLLDDIESDDIVARKTAMYIKSLIIYKRNTPGTLPIINLMSNTILVQKENTILRYSWKVGHKEETIIKDILYINFIRGTIVVLDENRKRLTLPLAVRFEFR
jgi:hypothetical protein